MNGGVALILLRAGNRLRSITLRADAHHLLTDVWISVGVVVAVVLVVLTGWLILDPLIALAVAANIACTAIRLFRATAGGVLDHALPDTVGTSIRHGALWAWPTFHSSYAGLVKAINATAF